MKKILSVVLALVMVLSLSVAAFAEQAAGNDAQISEMAAAIKAFDEAHPDLKDAWHEVMAATNEVFTKELKQAFSNIQEKVKQKRDENIPATVSEEDKKLNEEISEKIAKLIDASFRQALGSALASLDKLAKDGKVEDITADAAKKEAAAPATSEELQAAVKEFSDFLAAHPNYAEKVPQIFAARNAIISEELTAAMANVNKEMNEKFEEIMKKHNVSDANKQEIVTMLTKMMQEVNASFQTAVSAMNSAVGTIQITPAAK